MAEAAFLHAALAYCDVKVRQVDLNRLIRLLPCEVEGDPDCRPCWIEIDEGAIYLTDACNNCQTTYPLLQKRRDLGVQLPNLAKKMYVLYRHEIGGLDE